MKSDMELRLAGMMILLEKLGEVDAERFIALLTRESFDYTKWRQGQWKDLDVATLSRQAMAERKGPS